MLMWIIWAFDCIYVELLWPGSFCGYWERVISFVEKNVSSASVLLSLLLAFRLPNRSWIINNQVITLHAQYLFFILPIWKTVLDTIYQFWRMQYLSNLKCKNCTRVMRTLTFLPFPSCHSPLHRRTCHKSQTQAGSGSPPEPSRETCPPTTCVLCGSRTWMPRNRRSEVMTTKLMLQLQPNQNVCFGHSHHL